MLEVLYSDENMLILNKPAGLAVQPGAGVGRCLTDVAQTELGIRVWLVHRLDKETAGCLVLARSAAAARELSARLEARQTEKLYNLLVFGSPRPAEGRLDKPVRVHGQLQEARTDYHCLASAVATGMAGGQHISLVEARLGTGRMHQLRQHFAQAGWPIVGDDKYGDFSLNRAAAKALGAKKLCLYARRLSLPAIASGGQPISVEAAPPPAFTKLARSLGIDGLLPTALGMDGQA